jgi:hypothetical protein
MTDDVLRQAPLFSGLDDEVAQTLESSMASSSLRRGEILFNEGDDGDQLYVVTEGKIKLGRTSPDGPEKKSPKIRPRPTYARRFWRPDGAGGPGS